MTKPKDESAKCAVVTPLEALPQVLREREEALIRARRTAAGVALDAPKVGVALSGGGIRSATFALGFFQSLARSGLVRHIDYLSTASGGGYFGSFLGSLFLRGSDPVKDVLCDNDHASIRYLRENGRYLAPAGPSDLWLAAAVLLRNWLALQTILLTSVLLICAAAESVIVAVFRARPGWSLMSLGFEDAFIERGIWLSPWFWPPFLLGVFVALPLGWSYWTLERDRLPLVFGLLQRPMQWLWLVLPHLAVFGAAAWIWSTEHYDLAVALASVSGLALGCAVVAPWRARAVLWWPFVVLGVFTLIAYAQERAPIALPAAALVLTIACVGRAVRAKPEESELALSADSRGRHRVSMALKDMFVVVGGLLVFASIDSLARTLYLHLGAERDALLGLSGGVSVFVTLAAGFARGVAVRMASGAESARPRLSVSMLSSVMAGIVVIGVFTIGCLVAQIIAWGEQAQRRPYIEFDAQTTRTTLLESKGLNSPQVDLVVKLPLKNEAKATPSSTASSVVTPNMERAPIGTPAPSAEREQSTAPAIREKPKPNHHVGGQTLDRILTATLIALLASLLLGSSRVFLNRSTHVPLYSARLTRAYLGASNPKRIHPVAQSTSEGQPAPSAATRVMSGDDVTAADYWGWEPKAQQSSTPWSKGGPLHLINVTINETVDGRSQVQQSDRKGLGLAVGPVALSAGVRHHLIPGVPPAREHTSSGEHQVFQFPHPDKSAAAYPRDGLSLGQWMAISGAAFSTGTGSRTHVGLSLLAGFTNVRLGYWWRPGVDWKCSVSRAVGALFWVQSYLFREFLARFPGTQNSLWYLSDGGHFENMGAYELIRRRLPFILIVDAEADGSGQFEGLGNLVRKARLDFGAEIEFETDPLATLRAQLQGANSPSAVQLPLGPLAWLRRGKWRRGQGDEEAWIFEGADPTGLSRCRAALARIRYGAGDPALPSEGWLLYVKPALLDGMSVDLQHYASQHPSFPHESTGDQFFDEAQWESYRKLGELTGAELFPELTTEATAALTLMLCGKHRLVPEARPTQV